MNETPPYSLVEIRMLLSQYLDGILNVEETLRLDTLMEQFPQYRQEFLRLQETRGLVQSAMERQIGEPLAYNKVSDGVWKNIAKRLELDQKVSPLEADAEFISAYYDGEIPLADPACQAFEGQLYVNAEANRLLAQLGEVSQAVRQFSARLEDTCTLDITGQVMAAFTAEVGQVPAQEEASDNLVVPAGGLLVNEVEIVSAYADQALSPRETIDANRLIENNEQARALLGSFTNLSSQIQVVNGQLQQQAPDLWPTLEAILSKSPEEGGIVVPMQQRVHSRRWAWGVAAAVALLAWVSLPSGQWNQPAPSVSQTRLAAASLSGGGVNQANPPVELASVPNVSPDAFSAGQALKDESTHVIAYRPGVERQMQAVPSSSSAMRTGRVLSSTAEHDMVAAGLEAAPLAKSATISAAMAPAKGPSSDEYMFQALGEQMADEDIAAILGK